MSQTQILTMRSIFLFAFSVVILLFRFICFCSQFRIAGDWCCGNDSWRCDGRKLQCVGVEWRKINFAHEPWDMRATSNTIDVWCHSTVLLYTVFTLHTTYPMWHRNRGIPEWHARATLNAYGFIICITIDRSQRSKHYDTMHRLCSLNRIVWLN